MATRYVLFWFDVEDCTVPQSDDAARRLAEILASHGVRGTMKVVGQKARVLRQRVRYRVIDALGEHAIGFHSDMHGGRPQPAEYMAPLDWLEGQREFERRERRGVDELIDLFGVTPCTYGQPGSNWSPQVFPVLRAWGIPTYVSGYGYVGLHAQPFYYGGIVNTSHMIGTDRRGRDACHRFTLGFDLGTEEARARYRQAFDASYQALEDGGLISIANHPCQLVLQEWFSTRLKPNELQDAGYVHFEEFVRYVLSHDHVKTVTAADLPGLYPDRAMGRVFSAEELREMAAAVGHEVYFQERDGMAISAAELFGMFTRFLAQAIREDTVPPGAVCRYLDGPANRGSGQVETWFGADADDFRESVLETAEFIESHGRLPDDVWAGEMCGTVADWFCCAAQMVAHLVETGDMDRHVETQPARMRVDDHVDDDAARGGWQGAMLPQGIDGSKLLEQTKRQAWTLKPAILEDRL
ncbi:MAG: hypothetical protein U9R79_17540 [Armatimonadota bacterium]|nr:hypothetical protein [Armatimonadota bacterium]